MFAKLTLILLGILSHILVAKTGRKDTIYTGDYELTYFADGNDNVPFCKAMTACLTLGESAQLVVIKKEYLQVAVDELRRLWGQPYTWIGATDSHSEGIWTWVDGTSLRDGYTNWKTGEPNNASPNEHCMQLTQAGKWNDNVCDFSVGYICQKDTRYSTTSDYAVLSMTYSATGRASASSRDEALNFWDAQKRCQNGKMRLVEVTSNKSYQKLKETLKHNKDQKYWIGAKTSKETWKWISGKSMKYRNWADGYPTNKKTNRCLAMSYNGWEDYDCNETKLKILCEAVRPHLLKISDERPVVRETEDVILECTAFGFPLPDVIWKLVAKVVSDKPDQRVYQTKEAGKSTLTISEVEKSDAQRYHCIASNVINGTEMTVRGFADIKVISYDESPESLEDWKIERQETNHCSGSTKSDSSWVLPVVIALVVLVLLQFMFIIYQRMLLQKRSKEDSLSFSNQVFSPDHEREA